MTEVRIKRKGTEKKGERGRGVHQLVLLLQVLHLWLPGIGCHLEAHYGRVTLAETCLILKVFYTFCEDGNSFFLFIYLIQIFHAFSKKMHYSELQNLKA